MSRLRLQMRTLRRKKDLEMEMRRWRHDFMWTCFFVIQILLAAFGMDREVLGCGLEVLHI